MRKLVLVGAVGLLLAGSAMGAGQMAFTLQVGGDNHQADIKGGLGLVAFTPGQHDGYTLAEATDGTVLTWNVNVAVSDALHPTGGVQGVANMVFDVQLLDPLGAPVPNAAFFSTFNDGSDIGFEVEKAAFCLGWDVDIAEYLWAGDGVPDGLGPPTYPGRLFDTPSNGGPFMGRVQYPSISGFGGGRMSNGEAGGGTIVHGSAMTTNVPDGTLLGMGIGYTQLMDGQSGGANCLGVGIAFGGLQPSWAGGVGNVGCGTGAVAEGQIDMTGLPAGTYTLLLKAPLAGQNVIKAGYNPTLSSGDQGYSASFAEPVGSVVYVDAQNEVADSLTFVWTPIDIPPQTTVVTGWKSVKTHSTSAPQDFAITLNFATGQNATTESRSGRTGDPLGIQKIVMTTDGVVAPVLASPLPATWGGLTVTGASVNGADVIVTLSGCVDRTCYAFEASEIITNLTDPAADSADCKVVAIIGDANNGRSVTTTDYTAIKNVLNQPVTDLNCRCDINCGKSITTTDYTAVKNKLVSGSVTCVN